MTSSTTTLVAQPLTGPEAEHGEGPVWHPSWPGVRWVDMLAGDILELGTDGRVGRTHVADVAAAFRPRAGGGVVLARERGFTLLDERLAVQRRLDDLWDDPGVRMNEGGCDPGGGFWCGSMAYDERAGAGTMHRLAPDLTVTRVLDGLTISNGFGYSPDGRHAYLADTPTGRVDRFDAGAGTLGGRVPAVRIPDGAGGPDGLTVDAEGALWVALWGGGAVHRYGPDGRLLARVEVPVSRVTACTFGGPELDRLYITTSRQGMSLSEETAEPLAGALFTVRPGVRGLPVLEFAG